MKNMAVFFSLYIPKHGLQRSAWLAARALLGQRSKRYSAVAKHLGQAGAGLLIRCADRARDLVTWPWLQGSN